MKKLIPYVFLSLFVSVNSYAEQAVQELEQITPTVLAEESTEDTNTPLARPSSEAKEPVKDKNVTWAEKKKIIITRWLNSLELSPEQEDAIIALLSPAQIDKVMKALSDEASENS